MEIFRDDDSIVSGWDRTMMRMNEGGDKINENSIVKMILSFVM